VNKKTSPKSPKISSSCHLLYYHELQVTLSAPSFHFRPNSSNFGLLNCPLYPCMDTRIFEIAHSQTKASMYNFFPWFTLGSFIDTGEISLNPFDVEPPYTCRETIPLIPLSTTESNNITTFLNLAANMHNPLPSRPFKTMTRQHRPPPPYFANPMYCLWLFLCLFTMQALLPTLNSL